MALGRDQAIEAALEAFDGQRADPVGAVELQAAGEHPKGLRATAQKQIDRVIGLHAGREAGSPGQGG